MSIRNLLTPAARASGSLAGVVAASIAMGSSLPAHAQQAGASSGIEEIVVTAQRREENLQDVGIAVTALSGHGHHTRRAQPEDECVLILAGSVQHPRRVAERLR
jgi:iron complex outermembrane recepter protein